MRLLSKDTKSNAVNKTKAGIAKDSNELRRLILLQLLRGFFKGGSVKEDGLEDINFLEFGRTGRRNGEMKCDWTREAIAVILPKTVQVKGARMTYVSRKSTSTAGIDCKTY